MTEQALSEEEPHFCTNCGSPINSTDKFCTNCGAPIHRGSVAASDSGEAQASADGNSEQAGAYGEAQAAQPVEPVAPTDATQVAAVAEVTSAVEQAVSEAEQAANTAQTTASTAVAVNKPHKKAAAIAAAIVGTLVIASMLIILGLMQLNVLANPFAKARPVTFAIKAPHYNEKTDSKIPLHITGKTVSGKVISQHVYVSPKAPVVHLDPGVYKVQVEASPLMSSGEFYKTPAPLTVDTRSANAVISTAQPAKPQLTFEVKPANEVTQQDIALAEKFAKKTKFDVEKLKIATAVTTRKKVAAAYNAVLDGLDASQYSGYSLHDINGDGTPELLVRSLLASDIQEDQPAVNLSVWTVAGTGEKAEKIAGTIPVLPSTGGGLQDQYDAQGAGVYAGYSFSDESLSHSLFTLKNGNITKIKMPSSAETTADMEQATYLPLNDRNMIDIYGMSQQTISKYVGKISDKDAVTLSDGAARGKFVLSGTLRMYTARELFENAQKKQVKESALARDGYDFGEEYAEQSAPYLEMDDSHTVLPKISDTFQGSPYLTVQSYKNRNDAIAKLKKYKDKHVVFMVDQFAMPQSVDLPLMQPDMFITLEPVVVK